MIRSQAMRSFLRTGQEAGQPGKEQIEFQRPPPSAEKSVKTQHKFRLGPWGIQELATKPRKLKARGSRSDLVTISRTENGNIIGPVAENSSRQQFVLTEPEISLPDALPLPNLPVQTLGAGTVDPFDSLPIPASERIQFLLSYCEFDLPQKQLIFI